MLTNDAVATIPYPSGFNYSNCIVLSCEIEYNTNESYYYSKTDAFNYVQKNSTGVAAYMTNASYINKKVTVAFLKIS